MTMFKVQAFRSAPGRVTTLTRVTAPRTNFAKVAMRPRAPANLQSEFLSPVAALKGLCSSFSRESKPAVRPVAAQLWPRRTGPPPPHSRS